MGTPTWGYGARRGRVTASIADPLFRFVDNPDSAPVVSLRQFKGIHPKPKFVVLFSAPLVSREEEKTVRELPFTRDAFEAAGERDIVVTSVSAAHHEHSLFQRAITQAEPGRDAGGCDGSTPHPRGPDDAGLRHASGSARAVRDDPHCVARVLAIPQGAQGNRSAA